MHNKTQNNPNHKKQTNGSLEQERTAENYKNKVEAYSAG